VNVNTISVSPFTLVFDRSVVPGVKHITDAVILTTILSAGNSGLYLCTRIPWKLAMEGKAPRIFRHFNQGGIPVTSTTVNCTILNEEPPSELGVYTLKSSLLDAEK
jgi:lysine-specific permease